MKSNIDIDRISLEDRVNALELRVPGGSAGNWSGSIPFVSADVIDAAPDNAITNTSGGWLVKINIPDSGNLQGSTFRGMSVKMAAFLPLIGGMIMNETQVVASVSIDQATPINADIIFKSQIPIPADFLDSIGVDASARSFPDLIHLGWKSPLFNYYNAQNVFSGFRLSFSCTVTSRTNAEFGVTSNLGGTKLSVNPTVSCSTYLDSPSILGVKGPWYSYYGGTLWLGGDPIRTSGYTRKPNEQPPANHPILAFLPQSWR